MANSLRKANWGLKLFAWRYIPVIGFCAPVIERMDAKALRIRIPLGWRTRNHLGSMYFGALMVGADIAGGFLAFYLARQQRLKLSLAFKGVTAEFLRRPEADVEFRCQDGPLIVALLAEARAHRDLVHVDRGDADAARARAATRARPSCRKSLPSP